MSTLGIRLGDSTGMMLLFDFFSLFVPFSTFLLFKTYMPPLLDTDSSSMSSLLAGTEEVETGIVS
jgi:hypothetical protein